MIRSFLSAYGSSPSEPSPPIASEDTSGLCTKGPVFAGSLPRASQSVTSPVVRRATPTGSTDRHGRSLGSEDVEVLCIFSSLE